MPCLLTLIHVLEILDCKVPHTVVLLLSHFLLNLIAPRFRARNSIFFAGALRAPAHKNVGVQTKVRGPEHVNICRRFENFGGPFGPGPQKMGGHLENPGANGPWAPGSFEPWNLFPIWKSIIESILREDVLSVGDLTCVGPA